MDKERIMRLQNLDVLSKPQGKQITAPQVMEFLKMTWEALLEEDVVTPPTPRSSQSAPTTTESGDVEQSSGCAHSWKDVGTIWIKGLPNLALWACQDCGAYMYNDKILVPAAATIPLLNQLRERELKEEFLISYMDRLGWLPDHSFTFPDGETWYAKVEPKWEPAHTGFHPEESLKTQDMPEEWWKSLSRLAKGRVWLVAREFTKLDNFSDPRSKSWMPVIYSGYHPEEQTEFDRPEGGK